MPRARQADSKGGQYGVGAAGAAAGHAKNAVLRTRQGHGFAAERANHHIDALKGKRVRLVGGDNAKAGPDRIVNNVRIQSKYCATARATVDACFNRNGKPIYRNGRGLMPIEVPKDQYPEVLKLMAKKLRTDDMTPAAARKLAKSVVIEGNIEYATARRIVEAGTIDGISFDLVDGAAAAGMAGSISVAIAFACARWNGADTQDALRLACATGLKVGGVTWLSSVLTAQISRTGAQALVREGSGWMVRQLGSKTTLTLANALSLGERALGAEVLKQGGRRLTGKAAEGYLAKIMTGNAIAAAATTLVLSANDLCYCFSGHISKAQLFKNVANTAAGVAGGMGGWAWGAVQGATYLGWIPGGIPVGAAVGSVIGGIVGGAAAGAASRQVTDWLIEDDAVQMMRHLEQVFIEEAQDYALTQAEADEVMRRLRTDWDLREQMREMFASVNPEQYARWLVRPLVKAVAKQRRKIRMPSERTLLRCAAQLLDEKEPAEGRTPGPAASGTSVIAPAAWPFPTSSRP